MSIPVFLSYPRPHVSRQTKFITSVQEYLRIRGLEPRTLGVTDYDMDSPLKAIRRLMLESNGMITIAFRRLHISTGASKYGTDMPDTTPTPVQDTWLTSPWCQIEPAMAYQLGLPVLVLREKGVLAEGILEKGIVGTYMPEFSLDDNPDMYLKSLEWSSLIGKWEGYVRSVVDTKGSPPKLY
ncbi:MAG: hypothetical protein KJ914_00590 [Gammaproteobacteria bacterium]|nr:hypothetical protein [Gammaproteobacteria bacterium]MBU1722276.1 hypothetical protein [Gammaproteobacteria bacterium]MBU2005383.1 hypothetical protein [Gammaproteobacteria bacterium]